MKLIHLSIVVISLFLFSCKNDDDSGPGGNSTDQPTGTIFYTYDPEAIWDIFSIDAKGGESTKLTSYTKLYSYAFNIRYTRAIDKIVYQYHSFAPNQALLYMMDADGTNNTLIPHPNLTVYEPILSKNGNKILFKAVEIGSDTAHLYTMNVDGSNLKMIDLSNDTLLLHTIGLDWSPDNSNIIFVAYSSSPPHDFNIYSCNPDGSNLKQITNDDWQETGIRFSNDGAKILYNAGKNIIIDPMYQGVHLFTVNTDGTNQNQLTTFSNQAPGIIARDASWSTNDQHICFVSNKSNNASQLFTMSLDGTNLKQLTFFPDTNHISNTIWK